jgi:hypothetical protein
MPKPAPDYPTLGTDPFPCTRAERRRLRQLIANISGSPGTVWGVRHDTGLQEATMTEILDDLERALEANKQLVDKLMLVEAEHNDLKSDVNAMRRVMGL